MNLSDPQVLETVAQVIYCDSYTQYGTCAPDKWRLTSETQRQFCRGQARAVLDYLARQP
jgi:hypothetical protein